MSTFDELSQCSTAELKEKKAELQGKLNEIRQERWNMISAILFYEREIKRERDQS